VVTASAGVKKTSDDLVVTTIVVTTRSALVFVVRRGASELPDLKFRRL